MIVHVQLMLTCIPRANSTKLQGRTHEIYVRTSTVHNHTYVLSLMQGFIQDFLKGGGNSWLTYLASTFGRLEMSRVPFEQVLDIFKQKNRRIEL